ncbi:MAG TPA: HAMP domain-containing sensor histidine kinase [Frateuria sp.]|uniref:sensor histidine kinase n=1 Tax=Frateuria sp. TaxID=2211372 RepID=UPI002D7EBB5C|nr:HAMP domain-containing sensor histidine kinase [Frateuria sp.]HET6803919.1 HAMP domain-containing sensor histidine kinase [Frateuria sp.]
MSSADDDQASVIDELRKAIAVRDDFIAIAAHELRNPMTPIAGQVELLVSRARREQASPALVAGLERLEQAIDHYLRRASVLLEVSRLNAGQVRLEPSTFDMAELVALTTRNYLVLADRAGSALQCHVEPSVVGTWDRLSSEQVLDNLLSNAIRYGAGKPIQVELSQVPDGIVLKVRDEGIGIPVAAQARIFDRFERAGRERTSGGFGVGLWLVRQLVEAQGGKIQVRSRPSEGATFIVRLPRDITRQPSAEHP